MTNHQLDKIAGLVFAFFGGWVVYGAWIMPRFADQGAQIYEAPGLTPGLLGSALAVCGLILTLRPASPEGDSHGYWNEVMGASVTRRRALAAVALALIYGALLFGSIPYLIATTGFIFAFICMFELILIPSDKERASIPYLRILVTAAVIALLVAFVTQYTFQTLFLIQLS